MIATGGVITGLAALKRQDSSRSQYHLPIQSPAPAPEKKQPKRKPRTDVVVVRGKIRLYSASGFFLVLGVLILMVGIAMAVLGYWPHKDHQWAPESKRSNKTQATREHTGVVAQFFEQHLHSEKMKMLGPFTMGIGIFIFICANAILHENRDRETKVIHMRDMYSTVIDIHSLRLKEQKCMNGAYMGPYADHEIRPFGYDSQYASRLAANTLMTFSGLGGDLRFSRRTSSAEDEDGPVSPMSLLSPGYRERSGSIFGFQPEGMRHWEEKRSDLKCQTRSIVSSSISAFTLPVIKLNNCVIDEPDIGNITEDSEQLQDRLRPPSMESLTVPIPDISKAFKPPCGLLSRSNSAVESPASPPASSLSSLSPAPSNSRYLTPGAARKDFGSNNSLHMLSAHSKSLDLERGATMLTVQPEQRKHPSWPRLDRSSSKGYTKLENKEDPMDRLLVPPVAIKRDYTKKEKLLMISRSHNNLSFEHDEFMNSTLKRGMSETRF